MDQQVKLQLLTTAISKYGVDMFFDKVVNMDDDFSNVLKEIQLGSDQYVEQGFQLVNMNVPSVTNYYTPAASHVEQKLGFKDDRKLRVKYESVFGNCRIGRLLESLDIISGVAAYKFVMGDKFPVNLPISLDFNKASDKLPFETQTAVVTASCSELVLLESNIPLEDDVIIDAKVLFVGTSSMEIEVGVWSLDRIKLLSASFTFVGISRSGRCILPSLNLESEEDVIKSEEAKQQKMLKISRSAAILNYPTTIDQNIVLRDLLNNFPDADLSNMELKTYLLMQPEHRNIHGKIFGGFLMRTAAELSWSCAYLCTRRVPVYKVIKEQIFVAPVEVSDVCLFSAQVVKVEDFVVHIVVTTEVHKPKEESKTLTNKFYYEFFCQ